MSQQSAFVFLSFAVGTVVQTFTLCFLWDFLGSNNISSPFFTFIIFLGTALWFNVLLRPWSHRKHRDRLKDRILPVTANAALQVASCICLVFGLKYLDPLSVVVFRCSSICLLFIPVICGNSGASSRKTKGAIVMAIAYICLIAIASPPEHRKQQGEEINSNTGDQIKGDALKANTDLTSFDFLLFELSPHMAGIFALICGSILHSTQKKYSKKLLKEFGGLQRLNAVSLGIGSLIALLLTMFQFLMTTDVTVSYWPDSALFYYCVAILFYMVVGQYTGIFGNKLAKARSKSTKVCTRFISGCLTAFFVNMIFGYEMASVFTIICCIFVFIGLLNMTRGEVTPQIPHYINSRYDSSTFIHRVNPLKAYIRVFVKHLKEDRDSRRIMLFLSMNFTFMFVEFAYGFLTNSLGLISDACHMLFDCMALAIGLYTAIIAKMKVDQYFTFGYGRFKVLSGFVNAVFLVFIGFSVFVEAILRIMTPPEIDSHLLIWVSVIGLIVNLFGIFFFHQEHAGSHGHSHGHGHSHDPNIQGIFLHILADTLGSVGVIMSSLLIHFFGWTMSDAICSIFISLLILLTVVPLLRESSSILLQKTPSHLQTQLKQELETVLAMKGIEGYRDAHFWEFIPGNVVGTLHLKVSDDADCQLVLNRVTKRLQEDHQVTNLTVQIEKEQFLQNVDPSVRMKFHMHSGHSRPLEVTDIQNLHGHGRAQGDHGHGHGHGHESPKHYPNPGHGATSRDFSQVSAGAGRDIHVDMNGMDVRRNLHGHGHSHGHGGENLDKNAG